MKTAKYVLALGVALSSGAALAQSGGGSENSRQNRSDQNSQTELPSVEMKVDFGTLDANTDKVLSMDEVSSNSALSQAFGQLDTDKSGGLTNAEFARFESEEGDTKGDKNKDDTSIEEKIESGND